MGIDCAVGEFGGDRVFAVNNPGSMSISQLAAKILKFLTALLAVLELYWLNIALLFIFTVCMWSLPQSSDLLVMVSESSRLGHFYTMAGLNFYVFIIWYTSRAVSWQKISTHSGLFFDDLIVHLPRLMGFYAYAIFLLSYLNTPLYLQGKITFSFFMYCLLGYYAIYATLSRLFEWKGPVSNFKTRVYGVVFFFNLILLVFCAFLPNPWGVLITAAVSQFCFIFLVVNSDLVFAGITIRRPVLLSSVYHTLNISDSENLLFALLNIVYAIGFILYLVAAFDLKFAIGAGTLTVVFCALGVIGGAINLLKTLSFVYKINFGLLLIVIVFIGGFFFEPHWVRLEKKDVPDVQVFNQRQTFKEYFKSWLDRNAGDSSRRDSIVPLILVHTDGGASRSGYWVASVLGKIEDEVGPEFSDHLFCLSGASGGSVGNASFFSSLYLRDHAKAGSKYPSMQSQSQEFLKTDFLSFTLARMLSPTAILNYILPVFDDRARALERSMETGADHPSGINHFFKTNFSALITSKNDVHYKLPILCINSTRMQDGNPAVVSTIKIDTSLSPSQLDILSQLKKGADMHLSTAVLLGARFPFLTPAGRIKEELPVQYKEPAYQDNYYVDGGYFDNSGGGIIREMIQQIEMIKRDPVHYKEFQKYNLERVLYVVVHITNAAGKNAKLQRIHPFKNDFLAPLVTVLGTYSSQTAINDVKLLQYFSGLNPSGIRFREQPALNKYFDINLYPDSGAENYTMNWVISKSNQEAMNDRLNTHRRLGELINNLKCFFESQHGIKK